MTSRFGFVTIQQEREWTRAAAALRQQELIASTSPLSASIYYAKFPAWEATIREIWEDFVRSRGHFAPAVERLSAGNGFALKARKQRFLPFFSTYRFRFTFGSVEPGLGRIYHPDRLYLIYPWEFRGCGTYVKALAKVLANELGAELTWYFERDSRSSETVQPDPLISH